MYTKLCFHLYDIVLLLALSLGLKTLEDINYNLMQSVQQDKNLCNLQIYTLHIYDEYLFKFHTCLQPALLYLVPACLGAPCGLALLKGEIKQLFR